jgi:hypothetical protein
VQKRKPLEEAKPRRRQVAPAVPAASASSSSSSDESSVRKILPKAPRSPSSGTDKDRGNDTALTTTLAPRLQSEAAEATRFTSWFWQTFVNTNSSYKLGQAKPILLNPSHWLEFIFHVPTPQPVLQQALLAVSVTHCARSNENPYMKAEGRKLYTQSLGLLQKALNDPSLSFDDDILAAAGLCVLHELLEPTENGSTTGWLSHAMGMLKLVQHRGPQRHRDPRPRAALEHLRFVVMMRSLIGRRYFPLSEREWREEPWRDTVKTVEQQVFDHGLQLGALFEHVDRLMPSSPCDQQAAYGVLKNCLTIEANLQCLADEYLPWLQVDRTDGVVETGLMTPDSNYLQAPTSGELLLAISLLGIQLGAFHTAITLVNSFYCGSATLVQVMTMQPKAKALAVAAVRAISQYLSTRKGAVAAARLVFTLRQALNQLDPGEEDCSVCQELLARFGGENWQFGAVVMPIQAKGRNLLTAKLAMGTSQSLTYAD